MPNIELIQVLLICSSAVAVMATVPQLKRLIKVKSSREFSLSSYCMWTGTQSVSLAYMISIGDGILTVTSTVWALYYVMMVSLILYYRQPKQLLSAEPVAVPPENLTQTATANVQ